MNVRIIGLVVAIAVALATATSANASALTLYTSGSPGPWLYSGFSGGFDVYCEGSYPYGPPYTRYFQLHAQNVGRSPAYPEHLQDISMQAQLQVSANGAAWYVYETRPKQTVGRVRPGFHATFRDEIWDLSRYSNYFWRVRVSFWWHFAGTNQLIGTAVDGFTRIQLQHSAYRHSLANGEGVCELD